MPYPGSKQMWGKIEKKNKKKYFQSVLSRVDIWGLEIIIWNAVKKSSFEFVHSAVYNPKINYRKIIESS